MRDYYELIGVPRDAGADEVRRACRRQPASESWHDEAAIDFPSAARAIDRIRASFGALPTVPPTFVAEVSISPDEARRGADVPLMLPVRRLCPTCGGRGEVWLDACGECAGAGDLVSARQVRVTLPPGTEDGAQFRFALPANGGPVTSIEIRVAVR